MNKETEKTVNQYDLVFPNQENEKDITGAVDVVNQFSGKGLMLPTTEEHYKHLASKGALIVMKTLQGEVVGTAAYTQFYEKNIWEFGGWAVLEEYQNQGAGLKLVQKLFSEKPHFQTIAFGNSNSGPIFELLGAKKIEDTSILPSKAFELCSNCPIKPEIGCCDTVYNLSPVVEKLGMPDISWMTPRQVERLVYGIGEGQWGPFVGLGKDPEEWK